MHIILSNMKQVLFWIILSLFIPFKTCSQDLIPFRLNELWGYKDRKGNVKIEPQYQYARKFILNTAVVSKNDSVGAIDTNNNLIIPFKYNYLRQIDTNEFVFGYEAIYFGEYIYGVITNQLKIKIAPVYNYISKHKNFYTVTKNTDSLIGKGPFGDECFVKRLDGLNDKDGKVIIPCAFDFLTWINDSLIVLSKEKNQALYNVDGRQLTPFNYRVITGLQEGFFKVRIGDKYGFLHPNGTIAIPIKYDYCEHFNNGVAIIKNNDKWGAINTNGKLVVKAKYKYEEVINLVNKK
jgi:hypothetical protein